MIKLSNETIKRLAHRSGFTDKEGGDLHSYVYEFADFVVQAVLAKLSEQEPVAKVSKETFSSDGTSDIITNNLPIGTPLYAHPIPSSQGLLDCSNHIPNGRSIEDLADDLYTKGYKDGGAKDWDPRGCREWQDVVDAYNSKSPAALLRLVNEYLTDLT